MTILYQEDGIIVEKQGSMSFITYDAGAHQIAMRKDQITESQLKRILADPAQIDAVLMEIQRALTEKGIDPYAANLAVAS